jgi:hypothetical protein
MWRALAAARHWIRCLTSVISRGRCQVADDVDRTITIGAVL